MKDRVRTKAYQRAIESNPNDFKDKIVLDIGCGTGILSIFAARSGAKHVYAVENAEIAHAAREIVAQNGLTDRITVLKGKMEEVVLPVEQVDIIISEWMGYFLLYEGMLDTVLWARDKYLAPGGKMLPDKAKIYIASIEDSEFKKDKIGFWENVYGVNMKCLQAAALKEPLVDTCDNEYINSNTYKLIELDLVRMKKQDVNFSVTYELKFTMTDRVHALIAWFDTDFSDLENPVTLSTSPYQQNTHWKQTVFYLDHELDVKKGDVL